MESEDIKVLSAQFESEVMQHQIRSWKKQSTMLRGVCSQFWEEYGIPFSLFWVEAEDAIRLALVTTASEDLPELCLGPLMELACPELVDTEALIKIPENEGVGKASALVVLMEKVCKGQENKDLGLREKLLGENSDSQQGTKIVDTLLVVRTCMLLQYMTAIGLVWQQLTQDEED